MQLLRTTGNFKDQCQHLVVEVLLKQPGVMSQHGEVLPRKVLQPQNYLKCRLNAMRLFIPVAHYVSID